MSSLLYNVSQTMASGGAVCGLYFVIHACYAGGKFMGKKAKSRSKTFFGKKTNLEAFRADDDVQAILHALIGQGFTKTDIINESIRLNAGKAAVSILERQAMAAQHKWKMAQEWHLKESQS